MSVQANGKDASPSKTSDSVTSPKKRKHDPDRKESSQKKKKQKKQKTAEVEDTPAEEVEHISSETKKKKKRKSKDKAVVPVETIEEASEEEQDVELPDAASVMLEEEDSAPTTLPAASSTAIEGGDDGIMPMDVEEEEGLDLLESEDPSTFYSTRMSLYLPIPAISLETSTSSLLATHLGPLLLTYFAPAQGIILAYSDPVLSAKAETDVNRPLAPPSDDDAAQVEDKEVLAKTADEFGVCWVWLTATFLVFRPERGDELYGWTNVTSEGLIGLVSYNYFQTAVERSRIPADWTWNGPSSKELAARNRRKGKRGKLRDGDGDDDDERPVVVDDDDDTEQVSSVSQPRLGADGGSFVDSTTGAPIPSTLTFRVVDTEVVPAHERHRWSLQIHGTLLDGEAEQQLVDEARAKFERQRQSPSQTPGSRGGDSLGLSMSGALGLSREGSVASAGPLLSGNTPRRHRTAY